VTRPAGNTPKIAREIAFGVFFQQTGAQLVERRLKANRGLENPGSSTQLAAMQYQPSYSRDIGDL
jgi:hypothetical protein